MPAAPAVGQWTERHRPRHLGEIIGNTDAVRKLAEWLRDWDDVVLKGKQKEQKAPEAWQKFVVHENINARAALVSGPPGIGKTTTCTLIARCCPKYKVMEFNASDARSKVIIDNMSNSLAGNHTLKFNAGGSSIERAVIIMDECDGMTGGDKGGTQALKKMIQTTKNPIICICNERGDAGIRDLVPMCYDIKFKKPDNAVVAKRIKHVMDREGKKVELRTIEAVIEACGQDIRQIINQTQFFGCVGLHGQKSAKDSQLMLNPFDACERLLTLRGNKLPSLDARMNMFYLDTELMPMMVQENYLRPFEKRRKRGGEDELEHAARAAELISIGDSMSGNWEVLSTSSVMSTVYPAYLTSDESFTRPSFPVWLQKRAPMSKAHRVTEEVFAKIKPQTTCSSRGYTTSSYHDIFYKRVVRPLQQGLPKEAATILFGLGLTRDFFTEQAQVLRGPLHLDDKYKVVDAAVKNRLREELNMLAQEAKAAAEPIKRKAGDDAASRAKRSRGEEEAEGPAEEKKRMVLKKKKGAAAQGSSLAGWKKAEVLTASQLEEANKEKKPIMIMKFLDGHTNAVRRKVHMQDLLEPWRLF